MSTFSKRNRAKKVSSKEQLRRARQSSAARNVERRPDGDGGTIGFKPTKHGFIITA